MSVRRVTSQDVAEHAGVSQSAVSRVFTPGASVSKKMEARVRASAEALGYRPNVLARSLITGRSRIIGLVVAYLDNQFYPEALERLSRALQAEGYHVLVFMSREGEDLDEVIQEILDYQVDGIVAASVSMSDELARRCRAAGKPVVLFNRGQEDAGLAQVTSANRAGGRKVAAHFVAAGHKRIAHISGWAGSMTGRDRAAGFAEGLKAAGVPLLEIVDGEYRWERAAEAARWLMAEIKPDAIFVGNDVMAFSVMDTLRFELGLRVPQDVAVVGYDDVAMAAWPAYDLTTVRQPADRMVRATVELLLERIETPSAAPRRIEIDGPLVRRGSTSAEVKA
ncbi:MAG: LacI family DNA-binding transcriptional regulator [Paracoccaceae bacterium]|nr:LacI family DNA-binding transcriptional regulator [Paracoccaceae bacterium]